MKTIKVNLYKFSELAKEVQQKTIEKFREKKYNDPLITK